MEGRAPASRGRAQSRAPGGGGAGRRREVAGAVPASESRAGRPPPGLGRAHGTPRPPSPSRRPEEARTGRSEARRPDRLARTDACSSRVSSTRSGSAPTPFPRSSPPTRRRGCSIIPAGSCGSGPRRTSRSRRSSGAPRPPTCCGRRGSEATSSVWRCSGRRAASTLDTDFECKRSIEPLIESTDFFIGLRKPGRLNGALMGATPGHPLLDLLLDEIRPRTSYGMQMGAGTANDKDETGPGFLDRMLLGRAGADVHRAGALLPADAGGGGERVCDPSPGPGLEGRRRPAEVAEEGRPAAAGSPGGGAPVARQVRGGPGRSSTGGPARPAAQPSGAEPSAQAVNPPSTRSSCPVDVGGRRRSEEEQRPDEVPRLGHAARAARAREYLRTNSPSWPPRTPPGEIAFTRTPYGPQRRAK